MPKENNKTAEIVEKPWGREEILVNNGKYVIKRLVINRGQKLSLQYHKVKEETLIVEKGRGVILIEDMNYKTKLGDLYHLPPGTKHRICASIGKQLVILEVSTPQLDDVCRIEDSYGRT